MDIFAAIILFHCCTAVNTTNTPLKLDISEGHDHGYVLVDYGNIVSANIQVDF
jgi:hypothetical protein